MGRMKGITVKFPQEALRRLERQARESGRSVAALVRESLDARLDERAQSVYAITSDLAGSLAGGRRPATNARRRFRRP